MARPIDTTPAESPAGLGPRCSATTPKGERCQQSGTVNESGLCLFHDPARTAERREAQGRGGLANGAPVLPEGLPPLPETLDDVTRYLGWVVDNLARGTLDRLTAGKLTAALNAMVKAVDKRDLEKTVERLEAKLRAYEASPRRRSA